VAILKSLKSAYNIQKSSETFELAAKKADLVSHGNDPFSTKNGLDKRWK
jgi:hypothetical protein